VIPKSNLNDFKHSFTDEIEHPCEFFNLESLLQLLGSKKDEIVKGLDPTKKNKESQIRSRIYTMKGEKTVQMEKGLEKQKIMGLCQCYTIGIGDEIPNNTIKFIEDLYNTSFSAISLSKIDVRLVSKVQLGKIKGIGPKSADTIIDYRKENKCTLLNIQRLLVFDDEQMEPLKEKLIFVE